MYLTTLNNIQLKSFGLLPFSDSEQRGEDCPEETSDFMLKKKVKKFT